MHRNKRPLYLISNPARVNLEISSVRTTPGSRAASAYLAAVSYEGFRVDPDEDPDPYGLHGSKTKDDGVPVGAKDVSDAAAE